MREAEARDLAARADLLLFVVDHDLIRAEYEPLTALARQGKRPIVVLNKVDRLVDQDRDAILAKLRERLAGIVPRDDVVPVAASPRPTLVRVTQPDGSVQTVYDVEPPDLGALEDRIAAILRREGDVLRAGNLLLRAHLLGKKAQEQVAQERRERAQAVVDKFQWITAGTVFTNPIPALDLLANGAVQFQMISEIASVYGVEITSNHVRMIGLQMIQTLLKLGMVEAATSLIAGPVQVVACRLRGRRGGPGGLDGLPDAHLRPDLHRVLRPRPVLGRRRHAGRPGPPVRPEQPRRVPPGVRQAGHRPGPEPEGQGREASGGQGILSGAEARAPARGTITSKETSMSLYPNEHETIEGVGRALRAGRTTCVEVLEECFDRIEEWETRIRAWVRVDRPGAIERARALDEELAAGRCRGPLHGIPVGIKDIIDVAGMPTAAGFKPWAGRVADRDCPIVAGLREAGAVILGKTVTTQFAWVDPPPTKNPWDLDRTPGGSSSGSAAAVALGMCLGAVGTQTGGSIIRPASFCGVAGLKPSHGDHDRDELRGSCRSPPASITSGPSPGPSMASRSSSRSSAATGGMTRVVMTIGRPRPSPRWTSGSSATGKGHPGWAGSAASSRTGPTRRCAGSSTGRSRRWPTPERAWARPVYRSKCPKSCATIA